jgi:hypothetical protein
MHHRPNRLDPTFIESVDSVNAPSAVVNFVPPTHRRNSNSSRANVLESWTDTFFGHFTLSSFKIQTFWEDGSALQEAN